MSCPYCHGPDKYVLNSLGDCVPSGEYEHHYLCGAVPREAFYTPVPPSEMPLSTQIDAATFGRAIAKAVKKNPYSSNWALVAMAVEIATGEEISDVEEVPELIDRLIREEEEESTRFVHSSECTKRLHGESLAGCLKVRWQKGKSFYYDNCCQGEYRKESV